MYNSYNPYYTMQPTYPKYQPSDLNGQLNAKPVGLLGKSVESVDVVKAIDIPLDGSISYFPLADASAIITKQLQKDGTSKMIIYRPSENAADDYSRYATVSELNKAINEINVKDIKDIKEELKSLKRQIKGILEDIEERDDK